jgi:hypothetical protein
MYVKYASDNGQCPIKSEYSAITSLQNKDIYTLATILIFMPQAALSQALIFENLVTKISTTAIAAIKKEKHDCISICQLVP